MLQTDARKAHLLSITMQMTRIQRRQTPLQQTLANLKPQAEVVLKKPPPVSPPTMTTLKTWSEITITSIWRSVFSSSCIGPAWMTQSIKLSRGEPPWLQLQKTKSILPSKDNPIAFLLFAMSSWMSTYLLSATSSISKWLSDWHNT